MRSISPPPNEDSGRHDLSPAWIGFLIDAGYEAEHWSKVGPPDAEDAEVMRWAAAHGHIVLTRDRRPSAVQLRTELLTFQAVGASVLATLRQLEKELDSGVMVSIEPARARLRILPLSG